MTKIFEIVGLVLIAIMSLAFVGVIPQVEPGLSNVFWACAGGALMIIFYRKMKMKKQGRWFPFDQVLINRQIYKGESKLFVGEYDAKS